MDIIELVRKHEPVLLFSKDDRGREENFFPISAANYVAASALHKRGEGLLKERTVLTIDHLGSLTPPLSRNLYLTFAADEILEHDPSWRERLRHGGLELYSVDGDMTPQFVVSDEEGLSFAAADPSIETPAGVDDFDPMFSFSGPGTEPDSSPDPAEMSFGITDAMQLPDEIHQTAINRYEQYRDFGQYPPIYYFSTLNSRGFLVIQYWFFYAYNDWGSGHDGVNDHEGDWEMIALYLRGEDPAYLAYSAHTGSPEWHAWSDDAIEKESSTHPVVYVGSGSHANYFSSEGHVHFTFKDSSAGNSEVSLGAGANTPWGEPLNMGAQPWALNYAGGWGAMVKRFGTGTLAMGAQAPVSPPWQFTRWESPVAWANIPLY